MSGFVSGSDGTPLVGFEGAIVLQVAREVTQRGCAGAIRDTPVERSYKLRFTSVHHVGR